MNYQKKWWFNDVKFLLKHSNINIPSLTKKIWTRSYFFSSLHWTSKDSPMISWRAHWSISSRTKMNGKIRYIPLYCSHGTLKRRKFCGKKFLRDLFLRMKEFIFANATKLLKFAEFIFAKKNFIIVFAYSNF